MHRRMMQAMCMHSAAGQAAPPAGHASSKGSSKVAAGRHPPTTLVADSSRQPPAASPFEAEFEAFYLEEAARLGQELAALRPRAVALGDLAPLRALGTGGDADVQLVELPLQSAPPSGPTATGSPPPPPLQLAYKSLKAGLAAGPALLCQATRIFFLQEMAVAARLAVRDAFPLYALVYPTPAAAAAAAAAPLPGAAAPQLPCGYLMAAARHGTLRDLVLRERPCPAARLDLLRQAARSISSVHALGFVHCDVKPCNVLVFDTGAYSDGGAQGAVQQLHGPEGRPGAPCCCCNGSDGASSSGRVALVADFGSALPMTERAWCTRGTSGRLAPELARDRRGSGKADVYSFGRMVREVLLLGGSLGGGGGMTGGGAQDGGASAACGAAPLLLGNAAAAQAVSALLASTTSPDKHARPTIEEVAAELGRLIALLI